MADFVCVMANSVRLLQKAKGKYAKQTCVLVDSTCVRQDKAYQTLTHTQNPYNTYEQQHRHLAKHLNVYKYTRDVTRTWSKATFVVSSCLTIFVVCFNERHCYAITKTFVYMFFGIHVTKHNVYTSNTLCLLLLDLWCFVYIFWTRKLSNPFDCVNILWCRCIQYIHCE